MLANARLYREVAPPEKQMFGPRISHLGCDLGVAAEDSMLEVETPTTGLESLHLHELTADLKNPNESGTRIWWSITIDLLTSQRALVL